MPDSSKRRKDPQPPAARPARSAKAAPPLADLTSELLESSREAEKSAVATAMMTQAAAAQFVARFNPSDLLDPLHRQIRDGIAELIRRGVDVSPANVATHLGAEAGVEQARVLELADPAYVRSDATLAFDQLAECVRMRRLQLACASTAQLLASSRPQPGEAVRVRDRLIAEFLGATEGMAAEPVTPGDALAEELERIEREVGLSDGLLESRRMTFGLVELDELTGGLERGELVEIAGPTSSGKSLLAMHLAFRVAERGNRVVVFSAEMKPGQLTLREAARRARVPAYRLRRTELLSEAERTALAQVRMDHLPVRIYYGSVVRPELIWSAMEYEHRVHGLDLVIVDYDQLVIEAALAAAGAVREERFFDRQRSFILRAKEMAMRHECVFVLLCQLRKMPSRSDGPRHRRPTVDDLYGDSAIRNHPDIILWVVREMFEFNMDPRMEREMTVWVLKSRNGRTGRAYLDFDPTYLELSDWPPDRTRLSETVQRVIPGKKTQRAARGWSLQEDSSDADES
jgi:replicative DNA helicase